MKDQILSIIIDAVRSCGFPTEQVSITTPAQESFGDYATSIALQLAKSEKKNPLEIAQQIAEKIEITGIIGKVEVMKPGFINIHIAQNELIKKLVEIDGEYGNSDDMNEKKVIVEFSSPNIAKPFTVGHLRSTIIGDAIAHLFESQGATVFRDNHLGDWGTQFGKQIYAIKKLKIAEDIPVEQNEQYIENAENPVKELVALYVKFHEEAEKNPEIEEEARKWFKKLEEGDSEARRLWQRCIDWSWKEFDKIYQKLGIRFTENNERGYGESFFEDKMDVVLQELENNPNIRYEDSKGAKLVFFPEDKYPPLMILKQDGATLYSTRDLATDYFRVNNERYGKDVLIINEVGAEQALYFKQIYEIEKMLGWVKSGQRVHVKHGMFRFKDGKMSTRKGNTIWLEDVLEEAVKRAMAMSKHDTKFEGTEALTTNNKHTDAAQKNVMGFAERANIAEKVAYGALKWNDLKRSSHLDVVFDWDEILNMQGNSGPYIQYTHIRCRSILSKDSQAVIADEATLRSGDLGSSNVINDDELAILRTLSKYPEVVKEATANFAPNYITTYLYDLSQKYNLFYQKYQILKEENEEIKNLRLLITSKTSEVLKHGLGLLGIETVERM